MGVVVTYLRLLWAQSGCGCVVSLVQAWTNGADEESIAWSEIEL